jgi:hypothetical protein
MTLRAIRAICASPQPIPAGRIGQPTGVSIQEIDLSPTIGGTACASCASCAGWLQEVQEVHRLPVDQGSLLCGVQSRQRVAGGASRLQRVHPSIEKRGGGQTASPAPCVQHVRRRAHSLNPINNCHIIANCVPALKGIRVPPPSVSKPLERPPAACRPVGPPQPLATRKKVPFRKPKIERIRKND